MEEKAIVINNNFSEEAVFDLPAPPFGKVYRSKITGNIIESGIVLAIAYSRDGKWLDKPIVETTEDFELIELNSKM